MSFLININKLMDKSSRPLSAYPLFYNISRINPPRVTSTDAKFREKLSPAKDLNYYTKEDMGQIIHALKNQINQLTKENKMLKTKIVKLEKKKIVPGNSSANSKSASHFQSDLDKQKTVLKISEIEFENKILKDDIIKLKKIIDELTENPPPDYKKIYEKYVQQCIKIKKLKNQIEKHGIIKSPDSEPEKHLPKIYNMQGKKQTSSRQKIQ